METGSGQHHVKLPPAPGAYRGRGIGCTVVGFGLVVKINALVSTGCLTGCY
jgi:hypothetical protein